MSRFARAFLIVALLALLLAALLHLLALTTALPVWAAMIHLTLFGWISGVILAVNYHTLPVFSGRSFPVIWPIWLHWATWSAGIVLATAGLLMRSPVVEGGGLFLQCIAALLFVACTLLLIVRGPRHNRRPPVPPIASQPQVDLVGRKATTAAGMALPLALGLLLAVRSGVLNGSWTLAAEHLVTLGWIMLMIVGVAYHVLPRFSGQGTRGADWARAQLRCHLAGLVLIAFGLGFGLPLFFALGALLMALAGGLFAWTIWPTLRAIRAQQPVPILLVPKEHKS